MGSFARSSSPLVEAVAQDCRRDRYRIAEGKHSYDLEYQLPTEAPDSQLHSKASLPAYFLAGRGLGVTSTCSSAVYGDP